RVAISLLLTRPYFPVLCSRSCSIAGDLKRLQPHKNSLRTRVDLANATLAKIARAPAPGGRFARGLCSSPTSLDSGIKGGAASQSLGGGNKGVQHRPVAHFRPAEFGDLVRAG